MLVELSTVYLGIPTHSSWSRCSLGSCYLRIWNHLFPNFPTRLRIVNPLRAEPNPKPCGNKMWLPLVFDFISNAPLFARRSHRYFNYFVGKGMVGRRQRAGGRGHYRECVWKVCVKRAISASCKYFAITLKGRLPWTLCLCYRRS